MKRFEFLSNSKFVPRIIKRVLLGLNLIDQYTHPCKDVYITYYGIFKEEPPKPEDFTVSVGGLERKVVSVDVQKQETKSFLLGAFEGPYGLKINLSEPTNETITVTYNP